MRILRPQALKGGIPFPDLLLILTSVVWDRAYGLNQPAMTCGN
jgi:hypothetical protein